MGRHHARVLGSLDGVELVAVADPARRPARRRRRPAGLRSVEELIAVGIDYCMVAVPTAYHEEVGLALAAAGVHAMIEKPLAPDVAAATQAGRGVRGRRPGRRGRPHRALQPCAAEPARRGWRPATSASVYQIVTRRQGPFPARIADVGVVKDLATHDIDLTAWVAQQPFTSVSAQTAHRERPRVRGPRRRRRPARRRHGHQPPGQLALAAQGARHDHHRRARRVRRRHPHRRPHVLRQRRGADRRGTAIAKFRGVSEGDVIRYAIAKPEPLRTEHEAFRDAVLGKDADIVTMRAGPGHGGGRRGGPHLGSGRPDVVVIGRTEGSPP